MGEGTDDLPKVVIPEHITTKEADRRGRVTLGKEFAGRRVTVAVIDSEPADGAEKTNKEESNGGV